MSISYEVVVDAGDKPIYHYCLTVDEVQQWLYDKGYSNDPDRYEVITVYKREEIDVWTQ